MRQCNSSCPRARSPAFVLGSLRPTGQPLRSTWHTHACECEEDTARDKPGHLGGSRCCAMACGSQAATAADAGSWLFKLQAHRHACMHKPRHLVSFHVTSCCSGDPVWQRLCQLITSTPAASS